MQGGNQVLGRGLLRDIGAGVRPGSRTVSTFQKTGLLATLNTDDPVISDIDLKFEFDQAAPAAGLTADEVAQAQANALEIAFLTPAERAALLARKAQD